MLRKKKEKQEAMMKRQQDRMFDVSFFYFVVVDSFFFLHFHVRSKITYLYNGIYMMMYIISLDSSSIGRYRTIPTIAIFR